MQGFLPVWDIHPTRRHPDSCLRRRQAFTLIELLVVIAIILLLTGLLVTWAFAARRSQQVRATEAAMGNLLLVADTVKNASPIFPDHRLANYFFIQPHTAAAGIQPAWVGGANNRRMSSGEFIAFLASLVPSANTMVNSLGPQYLPASPVPSSWGMTQNPSGPLVDVFEQDPAHPGALDKDKNNAEFSLVSPNDGYRLRAPVDAWGAPLLYRLSTDLGNLNQADNDGATLLDAFGTANGTYKIREHILQDEQFTRDRYASLGVAVDSATANWTGGMATTATTAEYVRPAIPAYGFPSFMSAGPDGIWGRFTDLTPPNTAPHYTRDAQADKGIARDAQAKDNIYSQESGR